MTEATYEQTKQAFIQNMVLKATQDGSMRPPYHVNAKKIYEIIFHTLETYQREYNEYLITNENETYQGNIEKLALAMAISLPNYVYIRNDDTEVGVLSNLLLSDPRYAAFTDASYKDPPEVLPKILNSQYTLPQASAPPPETSPTTSSLQPEMQEASHHARSYFNWKTKLVLFAAPPVGIGLTYVSAAKDVKAVNDFFAENAAVIAAISTAYYAVLFVACAVQYCRNQRGGSAAVDLSTAPQSGGQVY